ncbi:hypothetical protein V8E53_013533 [Lactarius tabidus]
MGVYYFIDMCFRIDLCLSWLNTPPAGMAAPLCAFQSTPPVVRRREKNLLDVIRGAVRKGLSVPVAAPSSENHPRRAARSDARIKRGSPASSSL